jgi:hypothetical protein
LPNQKLAGSTYGVEGGLHDRAPSLPVWVGETGADARYEEKKKKEEREVCDSEAAFVTADRRSAGV